jgi:hypothetical protein
LRRAKAALCAGLLERLRLGFRTVRRIEQLVLEREDFLGAFETNERIAPRCDPFAQALLFFLPGERQLERCFGSGLIVPAPAPVKVHRRRMQLEQHAGGFGRSRLASDVFAREVLESEFRSSRTLPQEIGIQPGGVLLRAGEQLGCRRVFEPQQHLRGLYFRAAAVGTFDVQRRRVRREHRADLEDAVFLVENVHLPTAIPAN